MDLESYEIADLSPHLFWDVERENISWQKDSHFLVQRVLPIEDFRCYK